MAIIIGSIYNDNDSINGDSLLHPILLGTAEDDTLYGLAGDDVLDGGSGADQMFGGPGGDLYWVDNTNDEVIENADEGGDVIRSFVSFTMPNNVESLYLQGTANINGISNQQNTLLVGNSGNNYLQGGDGVNQLNGLGGADTLAGGLGNDVYVVDNLGDKIVEAPDTGTETVQALVSWDLRITYQPGNITVRNAPGVEGLEYLTLVGDDPINGIGNKLSNTIDGNSNNNLLRGLAGSDTLKGNAGDDVMVGFNGNSREIDRLIGGLGADVFVLGESNQAGYLGNGDADYALIKGFNALKGDQIQLQGSIADYDLVEAFRSGSGDEADTLIYKNQDLVAIIADRSGDIQIQQSDFIFV